MSSKRKTKISDQQILAHLRAGRENEACLELYREVMPMVERFMNVYSGSKDDASEMMNRALEVLIISVRRKTYKHSAAISTYLMGIVKNMWFKRLKQKESPGKMIELKEGVLEDVANDAKNILEEQKKDEQFLNENRMIQECLSKMEEMGRKVLEAFYFNKQRDKETAVKLGFKSANVVKSSRGKYLNQLRKCVKGKLLK